MGEGKVSEFGFNLMAVSQSAGRGDSLRIRTGDPVVMQKEYLCRCHSLPLQIE